MCDKNESPNKNNYKSTPPPTNRKIRNPFDRVLVESLHNPICSPTMCKIYKNQSNGSFVWDIDQMCTLVPTEIIACNSQFEPSPDPVLEKIAEEANEKFFSQEIVVPSPLESSKKIQPLLRAGESLHLTSFTKETIEMRDVSAQTILTLPPELPPELEKILEPFCTFTQDHNLSGDYEITANGSLRRKLFFEEHSEELHYDSELTDDEIQAEPRPQSSYEAHVSVNFSPEELSRDLVTKGMKRTFDTPVQNATAKPYRNKILDIEPCFSPIEFKTPNSKSSGTSSLASVSISPVNKVTSSDEEKNNFTSPESDAVMVTCLDCVEQPQNEKGGAACFCKKTPNKSILKRSSSLKDSPPRSRKGSLSISEKRSLSMSSLHRSRSVQKLDFSMDMSIDGSVHDHEEANTEGSQKETSHKSATPEASWPMVEEISVQHLAETDNFNSQREIQSSTKIETAHNVLDETPIKSKDRSVVLSHEISKIRAPIMSPLHMSLDNSLDNSDSSLSLEHKNIDFNTIDLKFLTEQVSQFNYTASKDVKVSRSESSTSFKKVDSGFNENTFYANASSYYESAIKPSELTITNTSNDLKTNKTVLKEISNVPWMRVDSGFKDENSVDNSQFYQVNESSIKKVPGFRFSEALLEDKENIVTENFDKYLENDHTSGKSMSDIFTEDMTFNCNFSSTPSKNKSRKVQS